MWRGWTCLFLVGIMADVSPVGSTFVRHNKLFRLRYAHIDICKDASGALKRFELNGGVGQQSPFVHSCELSSVSAIVYNQPH